MPHSFHVVADPTRAEAWNSRARLGSAHRSWRTGHGSGSRMTDPLGTYVIAAGGTGGHIIPGIALATEIRTHKPSSDILFVGTGQGLEGKIIPAAGFPLELVDASGFV